MIEFLDLKKINGKYSSEINEAIKRVLDSGWYLLGNEVKSFEKEYASYIGSDFAIGCANGLDALTLIFRAYIEMGIMAPGDEIIVPANTYIASILSISENGLVPVLVEPDSITLEIDPDRIEEAITPRTKGIMIVHLYGRCAYDSKIAEICKTNNLKLIEDNAQAHGCKYKDRQTGDTKRTGSLGDAAAHSFYPGKNLGALGDGGCVTTSDPELAEVVRSIANYGSARKYIFDYKGRNSRLDEIQAAVLRVKLPFLDTDNLRRKEIALRYIKEIQNPLIRLSPFYERSKKGNEEKNPEDLTAGELDSNVFHIFPVFCESRDILQEYLSRHGVGTLIHYPIPPHKQKAYKEWNHLSYPVSEAIHLQELSLPVSPVLEEEEVTTVINLLNNYKSVSV